MISALFNCSLKDLGRLWNPYVSDIMLLVNTAKGIRVRTIMLSFLASRGLTLIWCVEVGPLDTWILVLENACPISMLPDTLLKNMSSDVIESFPNLQQCLDGPVSVIRPYKGFVI